MTYLPYPASTKDGSENNRYVFLGPIVFLDTKTSRARFQALRACQRGVVSIRVAHWPFERCKAEEPPAIEVGPQHMSACWLAK